MNDTTLTPEVFSHSERPGVNRAEMQTRLLQFLSASLLFGAFSVAALPVHSASAAQHTLKQATPARTLDLKFIDTTAAMRLRGGGESHGSGSGSGPAAVAAAAAAGSNPAAAAAAAASAAVAAAAPKIIEEVAKAAGTSTLAGDQHRHAVLAQRMGQEILQSQCHSRFPFMHVYWTAHVNICAGSATTRSCCLCFILCLPGSRLVSAGCSASCCRATPRWRCR